MYNKSLGLNSTWVCSTWDHPFKNTPTGVGSGRVTADCRTCSFLKVAASSEYHQSFVPTSPVMTWTPETARKLPVKFPNIRGWAQGQPSPSEEGATEGMTTINQINHRWLMKQPWLMAKLQTIHLLHHTWNVLPDPTCTSTLKSTAMRQRTVT